MARLKDEAEKKSSALHKKMIKIKDRLHETQNQLRKMQEKVVKPMVHELKIKDHLTQRLLKQQLINAEDLKMLHAILKTPRLAE